jgi:translation initiation factor IF-3
MRLGSVKIDEHDLDTKARIITKFLRAGDKVRVSVRFRGREMTHPELARELFERLVTHLEGEAQVERGAALDGRQMSMILAPTTQPRERERRRQKPQQWHHSPREQQIRPNARSPHDAGISM